MKFSLFTSLVSLVICLHVSGQATLSPPHLKKTASGAQLIVNNKPFLITGGELGNSSASSTAYMKQVWPKLKQMNLNTVLAPIYWELMEPQEGTYDFQLVDDLIKDARQHNLKLVLLWFGTWKNSMSCYAPAWVKTNQQRFPRTQNKAGVPAEIITPFSQETLAADKKAFVQLMQHLKAIDAKQHTVLMVQVENEMGMLPEARDHSALANEAFNRQVPAPLIHYLTQHKNVLLPEVKKLWETNGFKTSGTWEEVFGKSLATDELFMAWHYGVFVEQMTNAGKQAYNLPMFVNAALNRPGRKPGEYPSAGPLPHVMDIWKASAPSIDFLSPDFYNPDFQQWNDLYTRLSNPLFIPEHRFEAGVDAKAFYAIGFSPFSIESTAKPAEEPVRDAYQIINQLSTEISGAQAKGMIDGVLLSKRDDSVQVLLGDYIMTVKHDLTLGWAPQSKDSAWPLTGGIMIALSGDEFYVGGTGIVITFKPRTAGMQAGILQVDEGIFEAGTWKPGRRLNGDEDHQGRHVRIPLNEYGIQRVKLYSYR
jgi:hypothetical protein